MFSLRINWNRLLSKIISNFNILKFMHSIYTLNNYFMALGMEDHSLYYCYYLNCRGTVGFVSILT